jgi:fatty acid desaturase
MFKASGSYYAGKMAQQAALLAATFCVAAYSNGSLAKVTLAATMVALFLQQSGWLCHDILHHQLFKDRRYGHLMGLVWGNLAQGFSVSWWTNKHNSHHAVPNLVESAAEAADGDPDIDTMPFLAWSRQMFEQRRAALEQSAFGRAMIRHQALTYFPLLGLARVSWLIQGVQSAFGVSGGAWATKNEDVAGGRKQRHPLGEKIALLGHYMWYCTMAGLVGMAARGSGMSSTEAAAQVVYFIAASNVLTGLFLAVVFGLGHNGMAVYHADDRPDFWKLQVSTTRNITGGKGIPQFAVDWFCGGLQYQVEHHLFPQIPRHNLAAVHDCVVKFCRDEGVSYTEADLVDGTCDVLTHLSSVSQEFIEHFPAL